MQMGIHALQLVKDICGTILLGAVIYGALLWLGYVLEQFHEWKRMRYKRRRVASKSKGA